VAGLIVGLLREDLALIGRSIVDGIVEPQRSVFIPGFSRAKESAYSAGALGFSISGSGPSVFALCASIEIAKRTAKSVVESFAKDSIGCDSYVGKINPTGAKVL
jgi:homoserine kinase